jgi:excisionase family DNA binding protein
VSPSVDGDATARRESLVEGGCLSVEAARAFLGGISRATLYALMEQGKLAWTKVGRRRVIPKRGLIAFLASELHGGWRAPAMPVTHPRHSESPITKERIDTS